MGSEEGELSRKIDSSDAGVLLVDEFEKAEPAVWNFFLDLLETGTFTDSQGGGAQSPGLHNRVHNELSAR